MLTFSVVGGKSATNKNGQSTFLFEINEFTMANPLFHSVENYDRNVFVPHRTNLVHSTYKSSTHFHPT